MSKILNLILSFFLLVVGGFGGYQYSLDPHEGIDGVIVLGLLVLFILVGVFMLVFSLFPNVVTNHLYGKDRKFF